MNARAKLEYLLAHFDGFRSVLRSFSDPSSLDRIVRYYETSVEALAKGVISIAEVYDKKEYRRYVSDGYAYIRGLRYSPLTNVFSYENMKFYLGAPAVNVVLYDHGILDVDAPSLPLEYDAVFDVGAYVGDSAVVLSNYLSSGGKVFSFEPDKEWACVALKNVKLNRVSRKVEVFNRFVGDKKDPMWVQLDEFAEKRNLDPNGTYLLKMDVEGYERDVLHGASEFIRKYHPVLLVAAYHLPDDLVVLSRMIKKMYPGYKLYFRHHSRPTPLIEYYIVAIPDTVAD